MGQLPLKSARRREMQSLDIKIKKRVFYYIESLVSADQRGSIFAFFTKERAEPFPIDGVFNAPAKFFC